MSNKIRLEEPNLISFVERIAKLASEGYTIDKTNQGAPQSWGPGLYTCDMTLEGSEKASDTPKEDTSTSGQVEQENSTESVSGASEEESSTDSSTEEEKPKTTRRTRRKSTSKK